MIKGGLSKGELGDRSSLTLKLGFITNFFKVLMSHLKIKPHLKIFKILIEKPQYIYIYKN